MPPKTLQAGQCQDTVQFLTNVTYEAFLGLYPNHEIQETSLQDITFNIIKIYELHLHTLNVTDLVYENHLYFRSSKLNGSLIEGFFLHFKTYFDKHYRNSNEFVNALLSIENETHIFAYDNSYDSKTFEMKLDYYSPWLSNMNMDTVSGNIPFSHVTDPLKDAYAVFDPVYKTIPKFVSKAKTILITKTLVCPLVKLCDGEFNYNVNSEGLHLRDIDARIQPGMFVFEKAARRMSAYICADEYLKLAEQFKHTRAAENPQLTVRGHYKGSTTQGILSVICTMVSLTCSFLTISTYCIFPDLRGQPGINNMYLLI